MKHLAPTNVLKLSAAAPKQGLSGFGDRMWNMMRNLPKSWEEAAKPKPGPAVQAFQRWMDEGTRPAPRPLPPRVGVKGPPKPAPAPNPKINPMTGAPMKTSSTLTPLQKLFRQREDALRGEESFVGMNPEGEGWEMTGLSSGQPSWTRKIPASPSSDPVAPAAAAEAPVATEAAPPQSLDLRRSVAPAEPQPVSAAKPLDLRRSVAPAKPPAVQSAIEEHTAARQRVQDGTASQADWTAMDSATERINQHNQAAGAWQDNTRSLQITNPAAFNAQAPTLARYNPINSTYSQGAPKALRAPTNTPAPGSKKTSTPSPAITSRFGRSKGNFFTKKWR
jgi:hypothetical protein